MNQQLRPVALLFYAVAALFLSTSCSRESKTARYLEQASRAVSAGRYDEAELAYKNVLKQDPAHPKAIGGLGIIYAEQGRIVHAAGFVAKGKELRPDDLELRIKYAELSLLTGNAEGARADAEFVLSRRPDDSDAPMILVGAAKDAQHYEAARARLESLPGEAKATAHVLTALAALDFRQGRTNEAEAQLERAIAKSPTYALAHSVLAAIHLSRKNTTAAEKEFRTAAELSPPRSPRGIQYAQFMLQTGNPAPARRYLEEISRKAPDYLPALTVQAELALHEKRLDDAAKLVTAVLSRDSLNADASLIGAQVSLARGDTAQAIVQLERLTKSYPRVPQLHLQLGTAHLAGNDAAKAAGSLREALSLAPGMPEATLALATLNLRTGDPRSALVVLKSAIQKNPRNIPLRLVLAEAHRAQKAFDDALSVYAEVEKDAPDNAQVAYLRGTVLAQMGRTTEARDAFEHALERAPGLVPAIGRLVELDVTARKREQAEARVEAELIKAPMSAELHVMRAKLAGLASNASLAEAELRKAIELAPDRGEAYYLLAQHFMQSGQAGKAMENLRELVRRDPKDGKAWALVGLLLEQQNDFPGAANAYEQILAHNPNHHLALNNLAYLRAEHLGDLDGALGLAQKAREVLPYEPHLADTLGWILFKKGQYRRALGLLEESASKLPDAADVHLHLGMTRYMLDLQSAALASFEQALSLKPDLARSSDLELRMSLLRTTVATGATPIRQTIERLLNITPGDPVALDQLGALQEREGDGAAAIATYLTSAKANPDIPSPLIKAARLYATSGNQTKALEAAKAARKVDPDNPATARLLGQIAFRVGDHEWSQSLLQEAINKTEPDAEQLFEYGRSLYSVGRVADAQSAFRNAISAAANGTADAAVATEAARHLRFIELAGRPAPTSDSELQRALSTDPNLVPALIARAALQEQQQDFPAAGASYEKALALFPRFTPAKVRLATIGAAEPKFNEKAYAYALQARAVYPDDTGLAKALGILTYRKGGESARAVTLLKQSASTRSSDPEVFYYLGRAQLDTKDTAGGHESLRRSIELGLGEPLLTEAQNTLARKS